MSNHPLTLCTRYLISNSTPMSYAQMLAQTSQLNLSVEQFPDVLCKESQTYNTHVNKRITWGAAVTYLLGSLATFLPPVQRLWLLCTFVVIDTIVIGVYWLVIHGVNTVISAFYNFHFLYCCCHYHYHNCYHYDHYVVFLVILLLLLFLLSSFLLLLLSLLLSASLLQLSLLSSFLPLVLLIAL